MPRVIDYATRREYLDFATGVLGGNPFDESARSVTQLGAATGEIICVSVFDHWHHLQMAELSIASNGKAIWATREYVNAVYMIAFSHFKLRRVNMISAQNNTPAISMHAKLGHVIEGKKEDWFGEGIPGIFYRYSVKDYRASRWNKWRLEQVSRGRYDVQDLEGRAI